MTLTEFLLSRIAEDEAVARLPDLMWPSSWTAKFRDYEALRETKPRDYAMGRYCTQFDPARVLAECEAKRRIVEDMVSSIEWAGSADCPDPAPYLRRVGTLQEVIRLLAIPYADHPDYDETWKP
jgi:hypothetical protein